MQHARKKRKRGESDGYDAGKMLRMKQLHVEGFEIDQIWEQAWRILDASRQEVQMGLRDIVSSNEDDTVIGDLPQENLNGESHGSSKLYDEDGFAVVDLESEEEALEDESGLGEDDEKSILAALEEESAAYSSEDLFGEEVDAGLMDEDVKSNSDPELDKPSDADQPPDKFIPDKHGLNDGFFSIDNFNKLSSLLEQQDARGEQDNEEEDEDIDWAADPLKTAHIPNTRKALREDDEGSDRDSDEDDDGDEDEEVGPVFQEEDSNASDSDDEKLMEDVSAMNNTNDIKYADFFDPPPRKTLNSDHHRAQSKVQPPISSRRSDEDDIQHTISAVRHDIFEDDVSPDDESTVSNADRGTSSRSNHQKRQAKISAEIRRLEAANVAKRDWTLSGEARAVDRPINSLLEEDLDFERAGKPVPVITNEVSEDIESLIKRRILAREFDEVIRRRPGNLATGDQVPGVRRGRFELDDTKPQQSLAEIYEAEHLKNVDPDSYVDPKDTKLKAQHDAIEALWKDISAKLDALSSLHFKPKPPTANITVVADVPAITIEDARPAAGGDVGGASMLAPQEVYQVGEGRLKAEKAHEVISKGGSIAARDELSREQKLRRRRREKERIRKAGGGVVVVPPPSSTVTGESGKGKKEREKDVLRGLKKGGVRVIGKKGEIRDVEGRAVAPGVGNVHKGGAGGRGGGYKL